MCSIAHIMHEFIQITRHQFEEPYCLNLVIIASNGMASGGLELYMNPTRILEIGKALSQFPSHARSHYLFESGSESPEDRMGYYFRLRAYALNNKDKGAIQLRLNNNEKYFPDDKWEAPQLTDFHIRTSNENIRNLGKLFVEFSELNHRRIYWNSRESIIDNEVEQRSKTNTDVVKAALAAVPITCQSPISDTLTQRDK